MFHKIFFSFWLTIGLFAGVQETAARLSHNEEQRTIATVRAILDEGRVVATAYEQHGADAAKKVAEAYEQRRGLSVDLLDHDRVSVIGRAARPAEIEMARMADRIAASGLPNAPFNAGEAIAAQAIVTSAGDRLTLVVGLPRSVPTVVSRALLVSWPARLAFILSLGAVVCLFVARHLTRPIVGLSQAANALADGRLQTRVGATAGGRRDELGALARDFDRMAERLESLVAGQRRLLGDVSHELRSPLTRLTVALSLARQQSTAGAEDYLGRIEREASRLDRLIEQLLTFARIGSGATAEIHAPFDLLEIVQAVVGDGDFEARADGKRVTLAESHPVQMSGMAELMRSAVENVVRNAIRHTPTGTVVEVSLRASSASAQVSVRDHGRGIDESMLSEMFTPFWRAPGMDGTTRDGAGLGLAITDRIARMHAGRAWATNSPDGGLIVSIEVPLSRHSSSTFAGRN